MKDDGNLRTFDTGATRDTATNKNDYEGFLSPLVIEAFGDYMTANRKQTDGSIRDSDNWQKGIPRPVYMKSAWRHLIQWWKLHRGLPAIDEKGAAVTMQQAIGGLLFNAMGYLHEYLKAAPEIKTVKILDETPSTETFPRFFYQESHDSYCACIYVILAPVFGRSFHLDGSGWVGYVPWRLEEMIGPDHTGWGKFPIPVEITASEAVKKGLPNKLENWPGDLVKHWPGGTSRIPMYLVP